MTKPRQPSQDWRHFHVRMPVSLYEAMKERAAAEDRTVVEAIRHACRLYLDDPTRR